MGKVIRDIRGEPCFLRPEVREGSEVEDEGRYGFCRRVYTGGEGNRNLTKYEYR